MITNVIEYLEINAHTHPQKIAIFEGGGCTLRYAELRRQAREVGTYLIKLGLRNKPIPVLSCQNAKTLVLFMGVVYSGNFYVPIDEATPKDRLKLILDSCKAELCLGQNKESLEGLELPRYIFDDLLGCSDDKLLEEVIKSITSADPLYMVYTSGSTGVPKGVIKSHGSMISFIESFVQEFDLKDEVIANQTPFYFDASNKDIYLMLKLAAEMHIVPKEMFMFPINLIKFLNDHKITYICWVPSALSIVSQLGAFKVDKPQYLRNVFFVGEVMPIKHLNNWRANVPARYCNLYGQSELAGVCCYYEVKREFSLEEKLPIGKPFSSAQVFLVDEQMNKITQGVGEICICSPQLAIGYYNDKEKTDKVFIDNASVYGGRMFLSGDLAEYDNEGNLVYVSRKDYQIKHMGHRIELMEIEVYANALDYIESCCCVYDNKRNKIVMFYVGKTEKEAEIVTQLKEKLPAYMIPNRLIKLDVMPKNKNGKIDRNLLKEKI